MTFFEDCSYSGLIFCWDRIINFFVKVYQFYRFVVIGSTWGLPVSLNLLYLLKFGSEDVWGLGWVDSFAVTYITNWSHEISLYVNLLIWCIIQYFSIFAFSEEASFTYLMMAAIYLPLAIVLEYSAWVFGVDAIRHIDPNWDEYRGIWYPYLFYAFGWVEHHKYEWD